MLGDPGAWVTGGGVTAVPTADLSRTCRTVVVNVGDAAAPIFALAQAQSFLIAPDGRAVPNADDPCDLGRALDTAPAQPVGEPGAATVATLVAPPRLRTPGPR